MFKHKLLLIVVLSLLFSIFSIADEKRLTITTSSPDAKAAFDKAIEHMKKGQVFQISDDLQRAINPDPNFAMAYVALAYNNPSLDRSKELMDKAFTLSNKVSEGEKKLLEALQEENSKAALKKMKSLSKDFPEDPYVYFFLAQMEFAERNYKQAIKAYENILKVDTTFYEIYNGLGYAYIVTGDFIKAKQSLEKYINCLPNEPNPYDSMGELLLLQKKYDLSIQMYETAIQKDEGFFLSYKGLGINHFYLANHKKAIEYFQKYFDLATSEQSKYDAFNSITKTYLDMYDIDGAISSLREHFQYAESNKNNEEMFTTIHLIGDIQFESGKLDEAEKTYQQEDNIRDNTDMPKEWKQAYKGFYLLNNAKIALKRNDLAKANELLKEHFNIDTKNPKQMNSFPKTQYEIAMYKQRYDDALKILKKQNINSPHGWRRMARLHEGKGETEKAKEHWRKIVDMKYFNNFYAPLIRHEAKKHLELLNEQ